MRIELEDDRPRVEITFDDGSAVLLSPLHGSDRRFLVAGFAQLSAESRYTRFGQGVGRLTDRELDYLSHVDQRNHVAWGAAVGGHVAGVARYIVVDDARCAEVAITVIDEFQQRGLGSLLFEALVAVARDDAVQNLCLEATADNEAVTHAIREFAVSVAESDGLIEARLQIDAIPVGALETSFVSAMNEFRRGL